MTGLDSNKQDRFTNDRFSFDMTKPRCWIILAQLLSVGAVAAYLISASYNLRIPLSYDQAEYVGAARDFINTGQFLESTHSASLGVILPVGYPAIIALVSMLLGVDPHQAALQINLVAGSLLPLLSYWLVWLLTASLAWSLWAGLAIACHWSLVDVASKAMTDPLYNCLFVLLAILTIKQIRKSSSPAILGGISGLVVAAMYLLRISAFYLVVGLPLLWVAINALTKRTAWRRLLLSMLVFFAVTLPAIGAVSWRFYQVNGGVTLSPQVSFNSRMGSFKAGLDNELWTLDKAGELIIRKEKVIASESAGHSLAATTAAFGHNLFNNLLFLKRLLLPPEPIPSSYWLALSALVLACLLSYNRRHLSALVLPLVQKNVADASLTASTGRPGKIALISYLQASAVIFSAGVILTLARQPYYIIILFAVAGAFFSLWNLAAINESTDNESKRDLLAGLLVTSGFVSMHVAAYSFLNSQERYMAQVLPMASACILGLLHRIFVVNGNPVLVVTSLLSHGQQADESLDQGGRWRRKFFGGLAATLAIFLLSEVILLQAKHTLALARQKGALEFNSASALNKTGEFIKQRAQARGETVRVVQSDSGIAYYSGGKGFIVPYLETRPDRLLSFLHRHQINFVSSPPYTAFGDIYTGIGLHHLLSAFTRTEYPGITIQEKHGSFFELRSLPGLNFIAQETSFPAEGVRLRPERDYLLCLTLHHDSPFTPKRYKHLNTTPTEVLELHADKERVLLAANTLCPSPAPIFFNESQPGSAPMHPGTDFSYFQVVRFHESSSSADKAWRVALSPQLPKEFRVGGYSLYAIIPEDKR